MRSGLAGAVKEPEVLRSHDHEIEPGHEDFFKFINGLRFLDVDPDERAVVGEAQVLGGIPARSSSGPRTIGVIPTPCECATSEWATSRFGADGLIGYADTAAGVSLEFGQSITSARFSRAISSSPNPSSSRIGRVCSPKAT